MNKSGPIIIIEDDPDDHEIFQEVFKKLNYSNEIIYFFDGEKALDYINTAPDIPFLILSDINMPRLNGMELRKRIHTAESLRTKCIPFLFFTTSANKKAVIDAYSMSAQGFFVKELSLEKLENTIKVMIEYWKRCESPNQYAPVEEAIIA